MIQGVVFDLDGTLIDSEPFWEEAERITMKRYGLELSAEDHTETAGFPTIYAIRHWYPRLRNQDVTPEYIAKEMNDLVTELVSQKVELKPDVTELLDFWKSKDLPIGMASASPIPFIHGVINKHGLQDYFDVVHSGDHEAYSKPHPGIYISACKELGVDPVFTVAFEDSMVGLLAAKSARMKAVALLDNGHFNDTKYNFADLKLESFHNFGDSEFEYLQSMM